MTIDDRDYMRERLREDTKRPPPGAPQSRTHSKLIPIILIVAAVLALCSAAIWFMRDAGGPTEGSLRVNINTATLTELESIPGIGPARAQQIVARRPYKSVDELIEISGIGPKSLESLRQYVKVEGEVEKLR